MKPATTLIGPNAPITIPVAAQPAKEHNPDYEVELAIVIGKAAKNVREADALNYVLGYTGANDVGHLQGGHIRFTHVSGYHRYRSESTKWLCRSGHSQKDSVRSGDIEINNRR